MEAAGCSVTAACDRMQLIMCQREVVRLSHIYIYMPIGRFPLNERRCMGCVCGQGLEDLFRGQGLPARPDNSCGMMNHTCY